MPIKEGFLEHIKAIHFPTGGVHLLALDISTGEADGDTWYQSLYLATPDGSNIQVFGSLPVITNYDFSRGLFNEKIVQSTQYNAGFTFPGFPAPGVTDGTPSSTSALHIKTLLVNLDKYQKGGDGKWHFTFRWGGFTKARRFNPCYLSWANFAPWTSHEPTEFVYYPNGFPSFDGGACIAALGAAFLGAFETVAEATAYYGAPPGGSYVLKGPSYYGGSAISSAGATFYGATFVTPASGVLKFVGAKPSNEPLSNFYHPPTPIGSVPYINPPYFAGINPPSAPAGSMSFTVDGKGIVV